MSRLDEIKAHTADDLEADVASDDMLYLLGLVAELAEALHTVRGNLDCDYMPSRIARSLICIHNALAKVSPRSGKVSSADTTPAEGDTKP